MEKKVIFIEQPQENDKPVEFTYILDIRDGWQEVDVDVEPNDYDRVVYLGKCSTDGDMFAAYTDMAILIFKGHLNSGRY
jgi:hypothetical protein